MDIHNVTISEKAKKYLKKVPDHIIGNLKLWADEVSIHGLNKVKKIPGYHDEPLKGKRKGQRSIRLSRSYRAIYVIIKDEIEFVEVQEVNKHDY